MKRKLLFLFALLVSSTMAWAKSGTCGDPDVNGGNDVTWDLTDGVLTISGSGAMKNYGNVFDIPWYFDRENITSVSIGSGVTSIGNSAFENCSDIETVTFEGVSSVETIGASAFADCSSLTTITIPKSVRSIGNHGFDGSGLPSITLPNSLTSMGEYSFSECGDLASVTFEEGWQMTSIPYGIFSESSNLKSITIPANVTTIGGEAFSQTGLTSINIPNGVETIGESAFSWCSGLTSVTIPASVTSIGDWVFSGCTSMEDVYCYANPDVLTWGDASEYFKPSKATHCHVPYAYLEKYNTYFNYESGTKRRVNVTFDEALKTNYAEEAYWTTYYNGSAKRLAPEGVTVYKAALNGSSLTLTEIADRIIPAGKAVILKKATAGNIILTTTEDEPAGDFSDNSLLGVDGNTTISSSGYASKVIYTLANESGLGFYKYTGTTLGANKAFLALDAEVGASAPARGFVFSFDDATGVDEARVKMEEGRSEYFNLNGQRVNKPTKGIFIVNGRKVIKK